jgi:hypothetical protein
MQALFCVPWLSLAVLTACSPSLNWRDVRLDSAPLVALFPCKPEQATRSAVIGAETVTLTVLACDAGDAKFALAYTQAANAAAAANLLTEWKTLTLANMRASSSQSQNFQVRSVQGAAQALRVQALGTRPDGQAVALEAVWLAAQSFAYQAVVYSAQARPQVADAYFDGLRLP